MASLCLCRGSAPPCAFPSVLVGLPVGVAAPPFPGAVKPWQNGRAAHPELERERESTCEYGSKQKAGQHGCVTADDPSSAAWPALSCERWGPSLPSAWADPQNVGTGPSQPCQRPACDQARAGGQQAPLRQKTSHPRPAFMGLSHTLVASRRERGVACGTGVHTGVLLGCRTSHPWGFSVQVPRDADLGGGGASAQVWSPRRTWLGHSGITARGLRGRQPRCGGAWSRAAAPPRHEHPPQRPRRHLGNGLGALCLLETVRPLRLP